MLAFHLFKVLGFLAVTPLLVLNKTILDIVLVVMVFMMLCVF